MAELRLRLEPGRPVDGVRHLCGMRRGGLPSPDCPCCGTPMLCFFSLDPADPAVAASPLGSGFFAAYPDGDWDFFVCAACPLDLAGYFSRALPDGSVEILHPGGRRQPFEKMVTPYPVCPVSLEELPRAATPSALEKQVRVAPSGSYHRLSKQLLWGTVEHDPVCPFCGGAMAQAAILDSDRSLDLRAEKPPPNGIALDWADGNYLAVSRCGACRALGYHAAFS